MHFKQKFVVKLGFRLHLVFKPNILLMYDLWNSRHHQVEPLRTSWGLLNINEVYMQLVLGNTALDPLQIQQFKSKNFLIILSRSKGQIYIYIYIKFLEVWILLLLVLTFVCALERDSYVVVYAIVIKLNFRISDHLKMIF